MPSGTALIQMHFTRPVTCPLWWTRGKWKHTGDYIDVGGFLLKMYYVDIGDRSSSAALCRDQRKAPDAPRERFWFSAVMVLEEDPCCLAVDVDGREEERVNIITLMKIGNTLKTALGSKHVYIITPTPNLFSYNSRIIRCFIPLMPQQPIEIQHIMFFNFFNTQILNITHFITPHSASKNVWAPVDVQRLFLVNCLI